VSAAPEYPPRRCRVLSGSRAWALARLAAPLQQFPDDDLLWVGEEAPEPVSAVTPRQVRRCLGRECGLLVFDAHAGFLVDAFAAALGTLRGGGELVLLMPQWLTWAQSDPARESMASYPLTQNDVGGAFIARLQGLFEQADCVVIEAEGQSAPPFSIPRLASPPSGFSLNDEQQAVVVAVDRVANGHARRPLVLTADRGRGKSTALGVALARQLQAHHKRVVLLAPATESVQAVFEALQRDLPEGKMHEACFTWQQGQVQYRSADEQVLTPQPCDLLVVDEAAAIALPLLEALLVSHNRVVFSSTVHGYEGSGRGFALRFSRILDRLCPQWKALSLSRPVRWAQGDPLETLANQALLLEAELEVPTGNREVDFEWTSQQALAADESLLRSVFALLISAHYQTRPSDLRQLMDAPRLHILLAKHNSTVVGVALMVEEGGFDVSLAERVCAGERRPRGHMLVQSLASHAGLCDAPTLRLLRVMRIAVAEGWRGQGIGTGLLERAVARARAQAFDLFGTTFGVDAQLLRFWRRAGLAALRLGHRRDAASGAHSVQMCLGLSDEGERLVKTGAARFQQQFPWRLARTFRALPADVVMALMRGRDCSDLDLTPADLADIEAFAFAHRGFEDSLPALWRWLCRELADHGADLSADREVSQLIAVVLQNRALDEGRYGAQGAGKGGAQKALRLVVAKRLRHG